MAIDDFPKVFMPIFLSIKPRTAPLASHKRGHRQYPLTLVNLSINDPEDFYMRQQQSVLLYMESQL